jgi:hypothetical protein
MAKIKSNAAEIIITIVAITILLCSCGSTSGLCPSYSQEQSIEEYYSSLDCQNCDEVD